jgi:hypothetical protein
MHLNQLTDFADLLPPDRAPLGTVAEPWTFDGWSYATDRRTIIRTPVIEGSKNLTTDADPNTVKFLNNAAKQFGWFTDPRGNLLPLAELHIEPVIQREKIVLAPLDWENPAFNSEEERYVARCTPIVMHGRHFDAKRLLFVRQTLADVRYYDEPAAAFNEPLRFVFGENREGQGLMMPMNVSADHRLPIHWNGVKFTPGT